MRSKLLNWAQGMYVAGLMLGLLFIIPTAWFPIQLGKLVLVALCMSAAAILFALSGEAYTFLRGKAVYLLGFVGLIPLIYLLSYATSVDKAVGITGFSVEGDTILFVALCYLVFALGFGLFRSASSGRVLLIGFGGAAVVAGIFQFVVIIFGTSILPTIFSDHSVNVVGKWNDLGILLGCFFVLMLLAWERLELSMGQRTALVVIGLATLLLLAIIHFPLVWSLILAWSCMLALWSFVSRRATQSRNLSTVPWVPICVGVLSGILLLWGSIVNTNLTNVFPVSSLEVRPSFSSTVDIIKAAHGSSLRQFLVGNGPQTFGEEWLLHKPASVNESPFWNLDFNVGFSAFMTALGSVGALGAAAWLIPMLLTILALAAIRLSGANIRQLVTQALGVAALFLWLAVLFYVPSEMLIIAAFALTGAVSGIVFAARPEAEPTRSLRLPTGASQWASVVSVILLIILGLWGTMLTSKRFLAEVYVNQGTAALQNGNVDDALSLATRAQGVEKNADDLRLATDAGLAKLDSLAQNSQNPTQQQVQSFLTLARQTIPQGQAAVAMTPQDYRAYLSLAKVYDLLASLGVSGAYKSAEQAYDAAAARDPMNPQIPLLLSRLEAGQNNVAGVQTNLARALTLKPDYTDAILFLVQLDVAAKDIPSAIIAAKAAAQSAPGVPSIWFELGLLYYSANDTADAIPPLEQAVKIESDYANAKYFLGLSYAAQGQTQNAIQQFQDLDKSNPTNQEVQLILSNLQSGKQPFAGAQPPVTPTPQTRAQAPISQ